MKGDAQVIEHLNIVLTRELTAINQYFLHARMLQNWGLKKLGDWEYGESIDEMKHADEIIKRILFLEGIPNVQRYLKLNIGQTVEEIIKSDLDFEYGAIDSLKKAISHCESVSDYPSRDLLTKILASEEGHIEFLETQLELITRVGLANYQQTQM